MISFKQVSIRYDNEVIFHNFSMQVHVSEKVVLSGPSGSGKSTLLNAIMGFVKVAAGSVFVGDLEVNPQNITRIRNGLSWLPQELSFDINSCRELAYQPFAYAANRLLRPKEEAMSNMMEQLLLPPDILKKQTDQISGGQKQRIILSGILLLQKPLLLLDEPTSALDDESSKALIRHIRSRPELTVISSSHDALWIQQMDKNIQL